MPVYVYDGRTTRGTKVSGERVAETKAALTSLLQRERITPTKIKEKGKEFALPTFGGQSITAKELAIFFSPVLGHD
jgi:type II secretory pathway component PulF